MGKALRNFFLPALGLLVFFGFWELYSSIPGVTLPSPIKTVHDSWNYIAHPFFDHGVNDKGLGWHILASLGRVAIGYFLAALMGVSLGILIGKSFMAYRALDPTFQILRTIPPF